MVFLKDIKDVNKLREAISMCKGDVILRSADGREELNLKSQLSQYIAIERLLRDCGDEYEFFCMDRRDEPTMYQFFDGIKSEHAIEAGSYVLKSNIAQAFRYDGDLADRYGRYYIPDWAIKAHKDRRIFYENFSLDDSAKTLFVHDSSGAVRVNIGDYIVMFPGGKIVVLNKNAMAAMFVMEAQ